MKNSMMKLVFLATLLGISAFSNNKAESKYCIFKERKIGEKCVYQYERPSSGLLSNFQRENKAFLDTLMNFLYLNDSCIVRINIHTVVRGAEKYNLRTSEVIKTSILQYFSAQMQMAERLILIPEGEYKPINTIEVVQKARNFKEADSLDAINQRLELEIIDL